MNTLIVTVALLVCIASPANGGRTERGLAALARSAQDRTRSRPERTYTNADLRQASGSMTFSRPAPTQATGPANPPPLRPGTRPKMDRQPEAPPPGNREQSPFISELPWGAEFKSTAQRELERFNRAAGRSSRSSGGTRSSGSSQLKKPPIKSH